MDQQKSRELDLGKAKGRLISELRSNSTEKNFAEYIQTPVKEYGFNFSNDNRKFETGAFRDSSHGKPRPDLLSPFATLRRSRVMELGAVKYGVRNWEKGMPLSVFLASANRHLMQFMLGETDEDHLAHCAFNLDAIMHGQEMIKKGIWPKEYDDLPQYNSTNVGNESEWNSKQLRCDRSPD